MNVPSWLLRRVSGRLIIGALAAVAALSAAAVLTTPREVRLNGYPCAPNAAIGTRIAENHQHVTVFQGSIVMLQPPSYVPTDVVNTSDPSVLRPITACPDAAPVAGQYAVAFAADKAGQASLSTNYLEMGPGFVGELPPVKTWDATITVVPDPRPYVAAIAILALLTFVLVRQVTAKPKS